MWDIKLIRDKPEVFRHAMLQRGCDIDLKGLLELDTKVRDYKATIQDYFTKRNNIAKEIGTLKSKGVAVPTEIFLDSEKINAAIPTLEIELSNVENNLQSLLASIPNKPFDDVPFGTDEKDNVLMREYGVRPKFTFQPKQHFELGEDLKQMNFDEAIKIAGSRFVVLKSDLALLERALANFMLDHHVNEYGYVEHSPPYLVNAQSMFGTGQFPKFVDDAFQTQEGMVLIPTSEVPLTSLAGDMIINTTQLPLRMTACTPCFRSEAGSAGRDTRGMLRQHQFHKVELVSVVKQEDSAAELERMTNVAESILQKLGLPYRVMLLCSQDMGFSACKTYDIEVWLPGQNCYREVSSCSNCGDFQARRMKARYKDNTQKITYAHTLNGSALAIGRTMIAIMENYQQENGDIIIPKVLQHYMHGKEMIKVQKNV